jgi:16S rRNA (uracil1498-N3)-methyltransferase
MKNIRIYQPTPIFVGKMQLDNDASHHLSKVLRVFEGQMITLFNGDGNNYAAIVHISKKICSVEVLNCTPNLTESNLQIHLIQGIAKGEKMDFLIQKAVELGVTQITPIITQRCVVRLKSEKRQKRIQHWHKIILAACEQSGRSVIPKLNPICDLQAVLNTAPKMPFVLHHRAKKTLQSFQKFQKTSLIIGPEGGLSDEEIALTLQHGAQELLLGKRVLRTETASLAALANLQLLWGS